MEVFLSKTFAVIFSMVGLGFFLNLLYNLVYSVLKKRDPYFPKTVGWSVISVLFICGISICVLESRRVNKIFSAKKFSTTQGFIMASETVKTTRGFFVPRVQYTYYVKGDTFQKAQDIYSPQFGTKDIRKASTKKILDSFSLGKRVKVYYDSNDPSNSMIHVSFSWDIFIRIGAGMFLLLMASFAISDIIILNLFSKGSLKMV